MGGKDGNYGVYSAIPGLEGLGESLMKRAEPQGGRRALMSFVDSERYYELHGASPPRQRSGSGRLQASTQERKAKN